MNILTQARHSNRGMKPADELQNLYPPLYIRVKK